MNPAGQIEFVHLLVTARCRNHCSFCFNSGMVPQAHAELDTEGWLTVMRRVAALPSLRYVFILEREPLERNDILEILKPLQQSAAQVFLCSGGSDAFTGDVASRLAGMIHGFIASYHGDVGVLDDATHERQQTMLMRVREHFVGRLPVDVNTTVTRRHKGRLREIVEETARLLGLRPERDAAAGREEIRYVDDRGVARARHNFVRPCLAGGMLRDRQSLHWTSDEREWFGDEAPLLRWAENCYADVLDPLGVFSGTVNGRPCGTAQHSQGAAGVNRLTIRWDGKAIPCASAPAFEMGDAVSTPLEELWSSAYRLWRMPDVVNARSIAHAFPEGHCTYGQDAAFGGKFSEGEIERRCREAAGKWS